MAGAPFFSTLVMVEMSRAASPPYSSTLVQGREIKSRPQSIHQRDNKPTQSGASMPDAMPARRWRLYGGRAGACFRRRLGGNGALAPALQLSRLAASKNTSGAFQLMATSLHEYAAWLSM